MIPREAVYQEVILLTLGHRSLQQGTGDLHWDDGAVSDVMLYQLPELKRNDDDNNNDVEENDSDN